MVNLFKDDCIELTVMECSICYVNKVEITLLCKHSLCQSCYRNIELCPFCRKRIKPVPEEIEIIVINETSNNSNECCYIFTCLFVSIICILIWISFLAGLLFHSNI